MPYKDPEVRKEKQKAFSKSWYKSNRELTIKRVRDRKRTEYAGTCKNCGGPTVGSSKNDIPEWCGKPECRRAAYLSDPERQRKAVEAGLAGKRKQGVVRKWKEHRPSVSLDDILERFEKNTQRRDVAQDE